MISCGRTVIGMDSVALLNLTVVDAAATTAPFGFDAVAIMVINPAIILRLTVCGKVSYQPSWRGKCPTNMKRFRYNNNNRNIKTEFVVTRTSSAIVLPKPLLTNMVRTALEH